MNARYQLITSLGVVLLLLGSCLRHEGQDGERFFRTWEEIVASDTLYVGTGTSPLSFFLYRGQPLGVEYQKALSFADKHGLELSIAISHSTDSLMQWLREGKIDLIISPQPMTKHNVDSLKFCGSIETTALVLVQRQSDHPVRRLSELEGKRLHTTTDAALRLRARQIVSEIGAKDLQIITVDTLGVEDLIEAVANSDSIHYALADERLAHAFAQYHPSLDVATRVSVPIRYGWVTRRDNSELAGRIDSLFIGKDAEERHLKLMQSQQWRHYFTPPSHLSKPGGKIISPYDHLFREAAEKLGWDWSMLAAIAYCESTFHADVIGWSGARGLMGIMPRTGQAYGVTPEQLLEPEYSIQVAVALLTDLYREFADIPDPYDRYALTLASYNAGLGHVQDARRLAQKHGKDPARWQGSVREYLRLKSTPAYYDDPVVKYGYVRGTETINYVDNIMSMSATYRAHAQK